MAVKLQKETSPLVTIALLSVITSLTIMVLYLGIPGTGFLGLRAGVFFGMDAEPIKGSRFMNHEIKCTSTEVLAEVRNALVAVKSDYPLDRVAVKLTSDSSGYHYEVNYVTYFAQRLEIGGQGRWWRRGGIVGDPLLDLDVKAKDDELDKAIHLALEKYFKSKGAQ